MKNSKNKWTFGLFAVAATAAALFTACGEDATENITNNYVSGLEIVDSVEDLPKCSKDNEGDQAMIRGENAFRICLDSKWQSLEGGRDTVVIAGDTIILKDTLIIAGDTIIKKDTLVVNNRDTLVIKDTLVMAVDTVFIKGEPMTCTTQELADKSGLKILCNGDSIGVVLNGKDGTDGKDGENGKDGVGCSITSSTDSTVTIKCGDDKFTMNFGGVSRPEIPETSDPSNTEIKEASIWGVVQKGPFVNGSKVTLFELDGSKSLNKTGVFYNVEITSGGGKFNINDITLSSSYAKFEAEGIYQNEIMGGNSNASIALNAYTNLKDRKKVNVNLLTHLEYYRVNHLMKNSDGKLKIEDAKKQAQKEIFKTVFGIDASDFRCSEELDIFGNTDGDAALLALSIMLQGDRSVAGLTALLTAFGKDIEADTSWNGTIAGNDTTWRDRIADWLVDLDMKKFYFNYATIRSNMGSWNLGEVPDFEKYLRKFWSTELGLGECNASVAGTIKNATSKYSKYYSSKYEAVDGFSKERFICSDKDSSGNDVGEYLWRFASTIEMDTYGAKCPATAGSLVDGVVMSDNKYACEGGKFKYVTSKDVFIGKACNDDTRDVFVKVVDVKSEYKPAYTCEATGWAWNKENSVFAKALKDSRDKQTYNVVAYDDQVWMAENLNYDYDVGTAKSYCYNNTADSCAKYGRLYTWAAAMDSAGIFSTNSMVCGYGKTCSVTNPARGVCPEGWHIPSKDEWNTLYSFMGKSPNAMQAQATDFEKWSSATDAYGFSALPVGEYNGDSFRYVGSFAFFWSAAENDSDRAFEWYLNASNAALSSLGNKNFGLSVRCIQD